MTEPELQLQTTEELAEGYPTLAQVVRGILADDRVPDIGVQRIEVNCFASGDATYRVWILGVEEPDGNHLTDLD
jgi:hypothetical protein